MLICFHIGGIDNPHLKQRSVELEKRRESYTERRKKGRELALKYAADAHQKYPKKFKSNLSMARHITPLVRAQMQKLYPGYKIVVGTVRKLLAQNSWHFWSKNANSNIKVADFPAVLRCTARITARVCGGEDDGPKLPGLGQAAKHYSA